MEDKKYLEEDKILANDILERRFYSNFRKGIHSIELYLTAICRANCEYCYLKAHQKELYPTKLHNYDTIVQNFELILNWYIENNFKCDLDIFSAEWITTPLFERIMNCIYDVFSKVEPHQRPPYILTADNMQFFKDKKLVERMEYHINRLDSLGIGFSISVSIDGKYCDFGRTENNDEYYKELNEFMMKHRYRAHPMISSNNIKYWIENYKWWQETFDPSIANDIMTLEVRDNTWTDESINDLLRYCDFLMDEIYYNKLNCNKKEFIKQVFHIPYQLPNGKTVDNAPYNVTGLNYNETNKGKDKPSCSLPDVLCIRVGDLSVPICHRLSYDELMIGKYNVENNKITDFEPENVGRLLVKTSLKKSCLPHCENCKFHGVCIGHCLGASYEEYGNPLVPQYEVCKMYKAKYTFIIYKLFTLGALDELNVISEYLPEEYCKYIIDLVQDIIGGMDTDGE